jgi:hypothetical protein
MRLKRTDVLAVIPLCFFVGATLGNFVTLNWRNNPSSYAIASAVLASPFIVLFLGHLVLARTWRKHALLIMSNLVIAAAWYLASFLMRWFQPGWFGIVFFSVVLYCVAGTCFAGTMAIKEPNA